MGELMIILKEAAVILWRNLYLLNVLILIVIVFFKRKDPASTWAWILVISTIPVLGIVLFLLFGTDLGKQKRFQIKEIEDVVNETVNQQRDELGHRKLVQKRGEIDHYEDLIQYNLSSSDAIVSDDNSITVFTDGNELFDQMIEDILNADKMILFQFYIIRDDVLFHRISEALIKKAKQGIMVKILYDSMGCRKTPKSCWKKLQNSGICTAEFFPAILGRFQPRVNYRNHRKIVVIDNKISYVGGFNIGKEYVSLSVKFGHWRDTHLRIEGSATLFLALRFAQDWNFTVHENLLKTDAGKHIPEVNYSGTSCVQVISSGPDSHLQNIHHNYLKLIHLATKSIYIQTPYFVPDESIFQALEMAIYSGVSVNIMIPCKPDHMFVYWASYSYIGELVMAGANCYTYDNGFLHTKGMIVDDRVYCFGTANMDIRSFKLNFEVNAVVYDEMEAHKMRELFHEDLKVCTQITKEVYINRSLLIRVKEQISRLVSPLL